MEVWRAEGGDVSGRSDARVPARKDRQVRPGDQARRDGDRWMQRRVWSRAHAHVCVELLAGRIRWSVRTPHQQPSQLSDSSLACVRRFWET